MMKEQVQRTRRSAREQLTTEPQEKIKWVPVKTHCSYPVPQDTINQDTINPLAGSPVSIQNHCAAFTPGVKTNTNLCKPARKEMEIRYCVDERNQVHCLHTGSELWYCVNNSKTMNR